MLIRVLLCALLIGAAGTVAAQPAPQKTTKSAKAPAHQLTAKQRAALQKQNQMVVRYAEQLAKMVDEGHVGALWDNASPIAKKAVTRSKFVDATKAARAKLGKMESRKVWRITRTLSKGDKKLPAGYYINVNFLTKFANAKKPVRELMLFYLDQDHKWRLSGYAVH